MANLLADGLNLGLTRMAEACSIASLSQLAWTADWHIRDETYALALRRLIKQQQREPLAAVFGGGSASSSDGQFFRAGGFGREASSINAHYGDEPGVKFYTHLSDRYAPFHTKVIAATASEAAHYRLGVADETAMAAALVRARRDLQPAIMLGKPGRVQLAGRAEVKWIVASVEGD